MSIKTALQSTSWGKKPFFISTSPSLIPIDKLIEAYASEDMYWAKPLPSHAVQELINSSLCFGLYEDIPESQVGADDSYAKFIGFARVVTDFVTFAYLTDVRVERSYQGRGFGTWLTQCVKETLDSMPYLRRTLLFTTDWDKTVPFFEEQLGAEVMEIKKGEGLALLGKKGRGHSTYVESVPGGSVDDGK